LEKTAKDANLNGLQMIKNIYLDAVTFE